MKPDFQIKSAIFLGAKQFTAVIFLFRQGKGPQEASRLSSFFNADEVKIGWRKPYDFGFLMRKNGRRFALFISRGRFALLLKIRG